MNTEFDIVVAGGGMIGASMALALAPLGLRIAVVEPVPRASDAQPSFDDRTTALSRSTRRMFEAMNIWDAVAAHAEPIEHVHVSDQGRFGLSHIDAKEQGVEALGHVVINRVLGAALHNALSKTDVRFFCPARVTAVTTDDESAAIAVRSEDGDITLQCRLLIAADGARSAVREQLGIGVQRHDYRQLAVTGNLIAEKPLEQRAFERFTRHGPLALLPMPGMRAGFIWTVAAADADRILQLDDAAFTEKLQREFGWRLGAFTRVGKRAGFPLSLSRAVAITAGRAALVGNAANGLHPVSAQGFNLGLRDVASLCDCIADARSDNDDIGTDAVLERYAEWRRHDQNKLVYFTDNLVRLFGSNRPTSRAARSIGMLAFDLLPGVRRQFARHTMGLAGRLPRLSRGVPLS